ncbi:MAG: class III extradiol ring-cleavage dioxygenase [Pseudomonadota bacterium]
MTHSTIPQNPAALFISHGGGPLPVLGDPGHDEMVAHLAHIAETIQKPSAIVVVSAHWEEAEATITAHPKPPLIYDYYGFPEESYALKYPASGDSTLAARLRDALDKNRIAARLDEARGFDHGTFIPLLLMYPEADIPCVQLSLLTSLDPEAHIRVGQALSGLAGDNILVLGSGFSFHNLKVLLGGGANGPDPDNEAFEGWLIDTCTSTAIDETTRAERLVQWENAPGARYCHPREEHLLPLHVCYGVTSAPCIGHAELTIMGKKASTFFW